MLAGLVVLTFTACEKEKEEKPPGSLTGAFTLEFEHVWGSNMSPFEMNTLMNHPKTGDELTFTTFKYYVSNVGLKKADGTVWLAEESYHLVDASDASSLEIDFENVPQGTYTGMVFMMGVDSIRNVSGAQEGALDPANGMLWDWNTGYIMIKAEGLSPQSSTGSYAYHLGGFYGPDKAVMPRDAAFNSAMPLTIAPNAKPTVHMLANPARLFHTYGSVSNGSTIHMPSENAGIMASDFQSWVRFDHIHP